jgi:hypothetical protein
MKFDKSRVYTALNADKLNINDEVIVADNLYLLMEKVRERSKESIRKIREIKPNYYESRFQITTGEMFILAYLVKKKE